MRRKLRSEKAEGGKLKAEGEGGSENEAREDAMIKPIAESLRKAPRPG
jgi:hypothetical protein